MANNQRLANEELTEIKERAEKATEGPWTDHGSFVVSDIVDDEDEWCANLISEVERDEDATFIAHAREDIPKLLAEIERLNRRVKDAEKLIEMDTEIIEMQQKEIKQAKDYANYCKGYADRVSEDINEYDAAIRNLGALADSIRYGIAENIPSAEWVADEIIELVTKLEDKVGEKT